MVLFAFNVKEFCGPCDGKRMTRAGRVTFFFKRDAGSDVTHHAPLKTQLNKHKLCRGWEGGAKGREEKGPGSWLLPHSN